VSERSTESIIADLKTVDEHIGHGEFGELLRAAAARLEEYRQADIRRGFES